MEAREVRAMRQTLFHGSDDGFTFIGAIVFLFILLLLVPAVSALLAGEMDRSLHILKERRQVFEDRQAQLDAGAPLSENLQTKPPLTDVWKVAGDLLFSRNAGGGI